MSNVYVVTKHEPLGEEVYVCVKASKKEAVKAIRSKYPNAREEFIMSNLTSYICKKPNGSFTFMSIREETIG